MCGGGSSGPSAEERYQKMKPTFGALPSLSMTGEVKRDDPKYGEVRTGSKRRSLLAPMMQMTFDQGAK